MTQDAIARALDYMSSIQNSEVVFDYMEPPEAFSEKLRQLEIERTKQLKKMGDAASVVSSRPRWLRCFPRMDFVLSKTSIEEIASGFGRTVQGLMPGRFAVHVVHARQGTN